jgi:hypothetical protein
LNAYPGTNLGETNLSIPRTKVSLSPAFSSNKYPSKLLEKFMFLERKVSSTLQGGVMERLCFFNWISVVGLLGEGLGLSCGTKATHKLPQETFIKMRKDNRNKKVKLFEVEKSTICALTGSDMEVMFAFSMTMRL